MKIWDRTVYYKRADSTEWKGPGVVIGQDGAIVFVRHGGILVRVHHSRLDKVQTQEQAKQTSDASSETKYDEYIKNRIANVDQETGTGR